jgi:hypothetical protein
LRLPHFLDNRLTDAGEIFTFTQRMLYTLGKTLGTYFCQRLIRSQDHSAVGIIL